MQRLGELAYDVVLVCMLWEPQARLAIYRRGEAYSNPDSDEILGYEGIFIGDAVVETFGDPSTVLVSRALREVLNGDRLLPIEDDRSFEDFIPREPGKPVEGSIVSVVDGVSQVGQYNIVVLNLGAQQGIAVGDVLGVYQRGATIQDRIKQPEPFPYGGSSEQRFPDGLDKDIDLFVEGIKRAFNQNKGEPVTLPDERAGVLMVFRTFDQVSYGLVMEATRAIHVYDRVRNP